MSLQYAESLIKTNYTTLLDYFGDKTQNNTTKKYVSLSAAAFTTYVLWKCVSTVVKTSNEKAIEQKSLPPQVKNALPLFGHLFALSKDPAKFLTDAKETYGPVFRIQIPGQGNLCVVTGSLIGEVMRNTRTFSFTKGIATLVPSEKIVKLSYEHKFSVDGTNKRVRNPVVYAVKQNFKEHQLDVFSDRIKYSLNEFLDDTLHLEKGQVRSVAVWDTLTHLVSHVSCPCFAGSKVGTNPDLVDGMANFTHRIINAGVMLSVLPTWLGDFVVRRFLSVEPEMDLIMKLIMPELEKIRERGYEEETTFISMVLNLKKEDGSPRTIQESAFYFNQIALASIHTTSHITSFTLHELACRPDIVNELRAELVQLGDNRNPETVGELPLMDSFLREVLRWNVDHLGMHHLCIKDTVLSTGHFIPKDTLIVAAVIQKHRNAIYDESGREIKFDKPLTEFDAHRFVGKDMMRASAVDSDYVAFGLGAHACPGRYFAVNEIKYVVSELITRYNITTESGNRASDNVALGMTIFPPKEPLLFEGR